MARAERVISGQHQAFRDQWRSLPSSWEGWVSPAESGEVSKGSKPWWRTRHLDPHAGDIKDLWEPARFGWVYDLVRGWLVSEDDRYVQAFYRYFQDWLRSSPPFYGPHWSCGQEVAIRAIALLHAESSLANAPSGNGPNVARVAEILAASGERIADAIGYALSQRNNHAISEATGLVLLGVRFAGSHPAASDWLERGHRLLEVLVREQFASDGWYAQHSFTYQRLALDQLVLAEKGLRAAGRRLSPPAVERIKASADLLGAVIEPDSGIAPNHGANDGSFVLPITLAEYRDFRPVITAVCATWKHPVPADIRPDPEVLAWLGLPQPETASERSDGVWSGESGWVSARVGDVSVFLRAGHYHNRPGHLDSLHVDVRISDREIVVDPGTYSYNEPTPWRNGLVTAGVHNGPRLGDTETGLRGPRFLWYLWPKAELRSTSWDGERAVIVAEIPGRVRRTVQVESEVVRVRDELLGDQAKSLTVLWTLHPEADPDSLTTAQPGRTISAERNGVRGWFSPHYGRRVPTTAIELCDSGDGWIDTCIQLPRSSVEKGRADRVGMQENSGAK